MKTLVQQPCCDAWAKAHEWGTDNEGWMHLVVYNPPEEPPEDEQRIAHIGSELPPVKFCPWCGKAKVGN